MQQKATLRHLIHDILDQGVMGERWAKWVHGTLVFLILLNVGSDIVESVPSIRAEHIRLFWVIEVVSFFVFLVEYLLRVWTSVEYINLKDLPSWKARLKFMLYPASLIDLLALLPFLLALYIGTDTRAFLILRLLRFFKLARYSTGLASLIEAIYSERNSLVACLVILFGSVLLSASFMHLVEHNAQPDKFGTIPDAMWWAIITLTTVGYGDVVPITVLGKVVAGITAITGIVMLALPVGIIASAFTKEINRRDFVVTLSMVSRIPLFAELDASSIAEIMRSLKSRNFNADEIVYRKGEIAETIYFVIEGQVLLSFKERDLLVTKGLFFGKTAMLKNKFRSATARTVTKCKLLTLDEADLQTIMLNDEAFATKFIAIIEERDKQSQEWV